MKTASRITLVLGAVAVLLAIWTPVGAWWQWALTALLFALAGAGFGAADLTPRYAQGDYIDHTAPNGSVRVQRGQQHEGTTLEQITPDDVDEYKRSYGKPSKENER